MALVLEDDDARGPRIRAADIEHTFARVRADLGAGPNDALVIDTGYRFRRVNINEARIDNGVWRLMEPLPDVTLPDVLQHHALNQQLWAAQPHADDEPGISRDAGVNGDGQTLYGPPGNVSTWGCTGYASVDTCKACCMATRTLLFGAIAKFASWCHAGANACAGFFGVGAAVCHASCLVLEAAMIAGIVYSMGECNDNCEAQYWNDTSISFDYGAGGQALHWDGAVECDGWVGNFGLQRVGRQHHVSIPGRVMTQQHHVTSYGAASCVLVPGHEVWDDVWDDEISGLYRQKLRVVGHEVSCPAALVSRHRWSVADFNEPSAVTYETPDPPRCLTGVVDYRVLDVQPAVNGHQTPYVGWTVLQDDGRVYIERALDGRLYLDAGTAAAYGLFMRWLDVSFKAWFWGQRNGDELYVTDESVVALEAP